MKNFKRFISLLLVFVLSMAISVPAFAAETEPTIPDVEKHTIEIMLDLGESIDKTRQALYLINGDGDIKDEYVDPYSSMNTGGIPLNGNIARFSARVSTSNNQTFSGSCTISLKYEEVELRTINCPIDNSTYFVNNISLPDYGKDYYFRITNHSPIVTRVFLELRIVN